MIEPYYDHGGITIYHGDCREIMPQLGQVDAVVTDPPYGIGEADGKNSSRSNLAIAKDYGVDSWDDETQDDAIAQAIEMSKHQIIFGGNYYDLPPTSCWLVWDKENGETDFADCELAWTNMKKAVRLIRWRWHGMLRKNNEPRHHPTQKPLGVMLWCIRHLPETTKDILDPFMGSGTTLVAAKQLGLKAIGIDNKEKYCEIAARRLAQEVLQFPEYGQAA